jgi:hypothetical protein
MTVKQNWYLLIARAVIARFSLGTPPTCETCGSDDVTLRHLTMERELPLASDVRFLCKPCYCALGPIPFSKRGASEPSKIDSKKPGQMPSMWVRAMDKKKRPNFAGLKV